MDTLNNVQKGCFPPDLGDFWSFGPNWCKTGALKRSLLEWSILKDHYTPQSWPQRPFDVRIFVSEAYLKSNAPIKWRLGSALRGSYLYYSIYCTPTVTASCTNLGQKAKNHLNLGENTFFARFLMCPSIIFYECRPEARKVVFLTPNWEPD